MNLTRKTLGVLLLLSISVASTSCKMMENAETAAKNSGNAAKAAGDSREEIANSRLLGRSGGSSASRREAFNALKELNTFEAMRIEASKYMKAFEFQLWTGQRYDDQAKKNQFIYNSVVELFGSITELTGKKVSVAKLSPFKLTGSTKSLRVYALATQLDQLHDYQVHATEQGINSESMSMYDILKKGLLSAVEAEKGLLDLDSMDKYEKAIHNYKADIIALFKARHDMYLTASLAMISDIKKNALTGLWISSIGNFQSKYMSLNIREQKTVNEKMLEKALETKEFLSSIGVEFTENDKTSKKLKKIFSRMKMDEVEEISALDVGTYEMQVKNDNLSIHNNLLKDLEL